MVSIYEYWQHNLWWNFKQGFQHVLGQICLQIHDPKPEYICIAKSDATGFTECKVISGRLIVAKLLYNYVGFSEHFM